MPLFYHGGDIAQLRYASSNAFHCDIINVQELQQTTDEGLVVRAFNEYRPRVTHHLISIPMPYAMLELRVLIPVGTHKPVFVSLQRVAVRRCPMLGEFFFAQRLQQTFQYADTVRCHEHLHALITR